MKKLWNIESWALALILLCACSRIPLPEKVGPVCIRLDCGNYASKAGTTVDEDGIYDVNLYIFDDYGLMTEHIFANGSASALMVDLWRGNPYRVYAVANVGFRMKDYSIEELRQWRYFLPRADGFSHGIPMAGEWAGRAGDGGIVIRLYRLLSKVSLRLDRSVLNDDVEMNVASVRVGNCPKSVIPFGMGAVQGEEDCFVDGFTLGGGDVAPLNRRNAAGVSGEVSLYLAENLQNMLNKVCCSYVEIEVDYTSDQCYSSGDRGVIYRFYLSQTREYRIERNSLYRITVQPRKDGLLCEDSWRVDKSSLLYRDDEPRLSLVPSGTTVDSVYYDHYYEMGIGDTLHISLSYFPLSMKVELDPDMVTEEAAEGRARYEMDPSGRGFSVYSLGRECQSSMLINAGEPLNDQEMIIVRVR